MHNYFMVISNQMLNINCKLYIQVHLSEFASTARGQSCEQINIMALLLSFVTIFRNYATDDYIGLRGTGPFINGL